MEIISKVLSAYVGSLTFSCAYAPILRAQELNYSYGYIWGEKRRLGKPGIYHWQSRTQGTIF